MLTGVRILLPSLVKRKTYTENLEDVKKELVKIRREGSFDTIYTSIIVLVIAGILSLTLSGVWANLELGLKIYTVLLGVATLVSLILQFLSIFGGNEFKKQSFYVLWGIILFIGLMVFSAFYPPSFTDWKLYVSVSIFFFGYLASVILLSKFFD